MIKRTKYIFYVGVIALAVASLSILSGIALADDPDPQADPQAQQEEVPDHEEIDSREVVRQTSDDTPNPDNAILAAETGLSIKQIDRAIASQESFGKYAQKLINRFPDQISAVWMDSPPGVEGPSTIGHVRFTGAIPRHIRATNNVVLTGNGLISLADHKRRAEAAADALIALEYDNFATFFDPKVNAIRIELLLPEGTTQPSKSTLIPAVRQQLGSERELRGRAARVEDADIELTVLRGPGPFFTLLHSRGGNWLRDDSTRECTSGWSVDGPNGPGIITAGHCTGLNKFEQPGVTPYSMSWRSQVINSLGDVEYHTTSHVELAEFYASASYIRDVDDIKATDTMVGSNVCFYGRASNDRTCNNEVIAVGAIIGSGNYTIGNQALTDSSPATYGDSGGGWSYGFVAWGVNTAVDFSQGYGAFTPAEEAQDALNVTIRTQ